MLLSNIYVNTSVQQQTTYITQRFYLLIFPCILKKQHDLTPRIYALHKITIALKFMSYINEK